MIWAASPGVATLFRRLSMPEWTRQSTALLWTLCWIFYRMITRALLCFSNITPLDTMRRTLKIDFQI